MECQTPEQAERYDDAGAARKAGAEQGHEHSGEERDLCSVACKNAPPGLSSPALTELKTEERKAAAGGLSTVRTAGQLQRCSGGVGQLPPSRCRTSRK